MIDDDEFSLDALFAYVPREHRLGFFTPSPLKLGYELAEARSMLERLAEAEQPYIDEEGYSWHIIASARAEDGHGLAWVEWRWRERGRHEDHDYYLKARDVTGALRVWEIQTYNPYFGCTVRSLGWDGDDVVLVYDDKHDTFEARLGRDGTATRRTLPGGSANLDGTAALPRQ